MSVETYDVVLTRHAYEVIDSDEGWFAEEVTHFLSKNAAERTFERLNRKADEELYFDTDVQNQEYNAAILLAD